MTITNRLTLYLLLALGAVLVGFSITLYSLTSWHLHAQADRHLKSALDLLVAAIEVHPGDVEWEPLERRVTLGNDIDPSQVRWTIRDENGQLIDCSSNLPEAPWPGNLWEWRVLVGQINAGQFQATIIAPTATEAGKSQFEPLPNNRTATRTRFDITIGLLNAPLNAELLTLAVTLAVVSIGIWLTAAIWGRWLCRRALAPVRQMADTARFLQQLPENDSLLIVPPSNDELTDLGQAFNNLLGTLRASIEQQRRFAGDASHQLRTPLAATLTAVEVALRREREPQEYQRILDVVRTRSRELTKIVETLLAFARNTGTEHLADLETVDLNQCCLERLDAWLDRERADDLEYHPNPNAMVVRSNPVLIGQVFDNLLENACKYSEVGKPIVVRVFRRGSETGISIKDRGQGISSQELTQVFEPFFRSPRARWDGKPGLGLGLAIANRFAALAGGRLEVESQEGVGSEFRLILAATSDCGDSKLAATKTTTLGPPA